MVRIGVGIVRSITTGASRRHYSKVRTTEVTTGFDKAWRTMGEEQKAQVIKEYSALEAQDWHTLTVDQKRASTLIRVSLSI